MENLICIAKADEPCDCGSHIRHNNGGNYHSIEKIFWDKKYDNYLQLDTSTCELIDDYPELIDCDQFQELLRQFQKYETEGWDVDIDWDMIKSINNIDIEKVRRRTRNILNETDKKEDILACACILGAKIF